MPQGEKLFRTYLLSAYLLITRAVTDQFGVHQFSRYVCACIKLLADLVYVRL